MSTTTNALRELHDLHQRAKALRDRLISGPKTLAAKQALLLKKQSELENSRKALMDAKVLLKKREGNLQAHKDKSDDLRVKLNTIKKNDEYKAILNHLALEKSTIQRTEDEILSSMEAVETQAKALTILEKEVSDYASDVTAFKQTLDSQEQDHKVQLQALERSIVEAESIVPEDDRERYARLVKQRGPDALASVDDGACSGCFVATTTQMMNELINRESLVFCKSCGRLLYLAENPEPVKKRKRG